MLDFMKPENKGKKHQMQYIYSSLPVEMRLKRIFNNYSWSPNGL